MTVQNYAHATPAELSRIRGVCLDIDDTLSTRGKLTGEAFAALWRLKDAGFAVVPITGRPAGWCDLIARFWPVDAVVGENGGFTFYMENGVRRRTDTLPADGLPALKEKLRALGEAIRARFPSARWTSDQAYREYDLAIDYCEDVPPWKDADVNELIALCKKTGAHAKLSSIHVNAWFGDYDKRSGFEHWLKCPAAKGLPKWEEWLYIGDSPNDEPMFAAFANTVGVANLRRYLPGLRHPPRWITAESYGAGFAEMAEGLIRARGNG